MTRVLVPAIAAIVLSAATAVAFSNVGMPLTAAGLSVVTGFWLLVAIGVRSLLRLVGWGGKKADSA